MSSSKTFLQMLSETPAGQDYLHGDAICTEKDAENLYSFFNPWEIPAGLTDKQIGICLEISAQKQKLEKKIREKAKRDIAKVVEKKLDEDTDLFWHEKEELVKDFGQDALSMSINEVANIIARRESIRHMPIVLPDELRISKVTRNGFDRGIKKLKMNMQELEEDNP
jgi:hypothetical protein